jgi:hypothetical protein
VQAAKARHTALRRLNGRRKSQAVHHAEIYSAIFAHKAVLALYFEHFRHPLPITGGVSAFWKTKEDFAPEGIPQFLLDIMPGYRTLMQGRWNEQKTFEYRHAN